MRSSNLGTVLLSVAVGLGFAGVVFSNISWAILSLSFVSAYLYAQLRFSEELRRTNLQIERTVIDDLVFTGEPSALKVEVLNRDPLPVRGTFEDLIPNNCALADGSNISDKILPPRTGLTLSYSIVPEKRGSHLIPGMRILRRDALGLFTETQIIEQPTIINSHTKKGSFDAARRMAGREHLEFSGVARNPAVVLRELEFDGIREYVPGDRARDIHWKSYPKFGKLMTKIYKKEGSLQTMIFVDCGSSMRLRSSRIAKIDHALDLSMQILNVLLSSFHPAGAAAFDELSVVSKTPPGLGRHQFEAIMKTLKAVPGSLDSVELDAPAPKIGAVAISKPSRTEGGEGSAFLDSLTKMSAQTNRKPLGLGLEGAVKEIIARSKGQEQLFIVISDLVSTRDAVVASAKVCKRTGNRMLVIHTYDDWYRDNGHRTEVAQIENQYGILTESLKLEATLRSLGCSYIRIGPADSASRIIRTIRRGKA